MKKCDYDAMKYETAIKYNNFRFLAHLLCPVKLSIQGHNIKNCVLFVEKEKCSFCVVEDVGEENKVCPSCQAIEKKIINFCENEILQIIRKLILKNYVVPPEEETGKSIEELE